METTEIIAALRQAADMLEAGEIKVLNFKDKDGTEIYDGDLCGTLQLEYEHADKDE